MAASTRPLASLALLSAALGAVNLAWPTWFEDLQYGKVVQAAAVLEVPSDSRAHQVVVARVKAKSQIVRLLLQGELDLFEAAGWFRYLNRTPEDAPARGWEMFDGRSEGERVCRQVIRWAEAHLSATATRSEEAARLRALEAELAEHLARHGRVVLVEP